MSRRQRNILVRVDAASRRQDTDAEMCEHKGIGHPDTIADGVCEAVACDLVRLYQREFGTVLHFNVDKGLLVGGRSEPRFGGGRVRTQAKMIVCGRASNPGEKVDFRVLVAESGRRWIEENLHAGVDLFDLQAEIREGSAGLRRVLGTGMACANDTSFGVGFAPVSELEQSVLELANTLKSAALRERMPAAGDDFKVMGLRQGAHRTFTIALALIDRFVGNPTRYFEIKDSIRELLRSKLQRGDAVRINQLDDPQARDEAGVYLTVTGLSAEMGDDGQVGRGNRVNGLITPDRPMSLEAAAGKNPYSHVGKIYNVLAHRMAHAICARVPEVKEANVRLLSTIGQPLDEPHAIIVDIVASRNNTVRGLVVTILEEELDAIPDLVTGLVEGRFPVY